MSDSDNRRKILIVEAPYYTHITDDLIRGAEAVLQESGYAADRVSVTGVFEIPAACEMAIVAGHADPHRAYAGIITIGCVIRGETDHYDHICREASRALMDISIRYMMPHGFGVLTCENEAQAVVRANPDGKDKGGEAARACVRMIELRRQFTGTNQ